MRRVSKRLQHSLLESVLALLVHAGLKDEEIWCAAESSLARLRRKRGLKKGDPHLQSGDLPADLMRIWHCDVRYLDEYSAKPKPLHLTKGKNSIRAAISRLNPNAKVDDVVAFLVASKLIRRLPDGRYLPTSDAGMISQADQFVTEHLIKSVSRLIHTIKRNSLLQPGRQPLIERFAYVSDLDKNEVEAFCEFTKTHGHSYLQVVDDWMEQRKVGVKRKGRVSRGPGVVAGVQVIAYVGDEDVGIRRRSLGRSSQERGCERVTSP